MKLDFKSWIIGLVLALLCEVMGRIYDTCIVFNLSTHFFFNPIFFTISHLR
jgi:hypothetical protein